MHMIITVLGWMFFVILVLVGFAISRIWWAVRKLKKGLGGLSDFPMTPPTIELFPLDQQGVDTELDPGTDQLSKAGWRRLGAFTADAFPGLRLRGFSDGTAYAVLYTLPGIGEWVDIVCKKDESDVTFSNAPQGAELEHPPWTKKHYMQDATLETVLAAYTDLRRIGGLRPLRENEFQSEFESAFQREQEWRLAKGGVSEDEVKRIIASMGEEVDAEAIDCVMDEQHDQMVVSLSQLCLSRFLEDGGMSAAEAHKLHDRLFVVHANMTERDGVDLADLHLELPESLYDDDGELELRLPEGEGLPPAFRVFVDGLPAQHRARYCGSVAEPVAADIWVARH